MSLLSKLTQFYKRELRSLPHDKADLFDLAWQLANLLEDYGPNSNMWKNSEKEFDDFITQIRIDKNSVKDLVVWIDTAVDHMHQSLLNSQHDDSENLLFQYLSQDIVQYLLNRDNDSAWQEAESWLEEEEHKLKKMDELELEFERKLEKSL